METVSSLKDHGEEMSDTYGSYSGSRQWHLPRTRSDLHSTCETSEPDSEGRTYDSREEEMPVDVPVHFVPHCNENEVYARYLFHTRRQEPNENVEDFITGLHTLSSCCCFDFLRDSLIRDRIIVGVRDERTRQRLLREVSLPLQRCVQICRESEALLQQPEDGSGETKYAESETSRLDQDRDRAAQDEDHRSDNHTASAVMQSIPPLASSDQLTCTQCSIQCDSLSDLQAHTENVHVKVEKSLPASSEEPSYCCPCGRKFAQLYAFQNHRCRFHKEDRPCVDSRRKAVTGTSGNTENAVVPSKQQKVRRQNSTSSEREDMLDADEEDGPVSPGRTDEEEISVIESIDSTATSESNLGKAEGKSAHKCLTCSKVFKKSEMTKYLGHRKRCSKVQCGVCPALLSAGSMSRHVKMKHKPGELQCRTCLARFASRNLLKSHLVSTHHEHKDAKPGLQNCSSHECSICSAVFSAPKFLTKHLEVFNHEAARYQCSLCLKSFKRESSLVEHMTVEHALDAELSKLGVCPCGLGFASQEELERHGRKCKRVLCQVCGVDLNASDMARHLRNLCAEEEHACRVCSETFSSKSKLSEHVRERGHKPLAKRNATTEMGEARDVLQSFTCEFCQESFSTIGDFTYHVFSFSHLHDADGAQCPVCKKIYQDRHTLKEHLLTHSEERPFVCDQCGLAFKKKYLLQNHCYIHTGEKRCKCEYCGRMFNQPAYLKKHLRLHTGERPYECHLCGQRFHVNSGLFIHMRRHTGERPYTCEVCGKSYIMLCHLKNHRATHSEERPFSCSICGRGFKTRKEMRAHEFLHTGIKRFICQACGMDFARSSNLAQHIRKYHPELVSSLNTKSPVVPGPAESQ